MKKYRPRGTYKYQVLVGGKVVHYGITDDLSLTETKYKERWPDCKLVQVGQKSTRKGALKWQISETERKRKPKTVMLIAVCSATVLIVGLIAIRWTEIRGVNWTPDMIGSSNTVGWSVGLATVLWISAWTIFCGVAAVALAAVPTLFLPQQIKTWRLNRKPNWSAIKGFFTWVKSNLGWGAVIFFSTICLLFPALMCGFWGECSVGVTTDKYKEVMIIDKHYLLRSEHIQILLREVDHILYYRHYSQGGGWSGYVDAIKLDGTEIKVSSDGPRAQQDFARQVAQVTGKKLVEKK
jgi:hypothetical protein